MGAWAMFAAPLIMGNDVRSLTAAHRAILQNAEVIAIDQDPAGASSLLSLSAMPLPFAEGSIAYNI